MRYIKCRMTNTVVSGWTVSAVVQKHIAFQLLFMHKICASINYGWSRQKDTMVTCNSLHSHHFQQRHLYYANACKSVLYNNPLLKGLVSFNILILIIHWSFIDIYILITIKKQRKSSIDNIIVIKVLIVAFCGQEQCRIKGRSRKKKSIKYFRDCWQCREEIRRILILTKRRFHGEFSSTLISEAVRVSDSA